MQDGGGERGAAEGGDDDLVAGADAEGGEDQVEGGGAAGAGDHVGGAEPVAQGVLEAAGAVAQDELLVRPGPDLAEQPQEGLAVLVEEVGREEGDAAAGRGA